MNISDLIKLATKVSGLDENQAKTVIYYSMATHHLLDFNWFPALDFVGPPGTGKSKAIDFLTQLCFKPYPITCHATMSPAVFRDELGHAINKTAIVEEADLYPNRKQLQSYLINRVDRLRTSEMKVKELTETKSGAKIWKTISYKGYGATVIHDRHSMDDLATESRSIIINTALREGNYIDVPKGLVLPVFSLGNVPDYFNQSGRAFDTWKPLIMVASSLGDDDWLIYAFQQIEEATDSLREGHAYEEKQAIFSQVIKGYCDNSGFGLMVKQNVGLTLQSSVVESLKRDMPYVTARMVAQTLNKLGLKVVRHSGTNKLFTTKEQLIKVAKDIGYEDEVLNV